MASTEHPPPVRAILWCVPRCLSTALLRAMSNVDDYQVWCEPYLNVIYRQSTVPDHFINLDPDIIPKHFYSLFDEHNTYDRVKTQLEGDYPGKRLVFVKEMVKGIQGHYESIPRGYKHAFLIRHPLKVFSSLKKMFQIQNWPLGGDVDLDKAPSSVIPPGLYFKELVDLYHHIKECYDPHPMILEADDLQANPERIVKTFCKQIGVPFDDRIVKWDGDVTFDNWMCPKELLPVFTTDGVHKKSCSGGSTGFTPPSDLPARNNLPQDVVRVADACMEYYEFLRGLKTNVDCN